MSETQMSKKKLVARTTNGPAIVSNKSACGSTDTNTSRSDCHAGNTLNDICSSRAISDTAQNNPNSISFSNNASTAGRNVTSQQLITTFFRSTSVIDNQSANNRVQAKPTSTVNLA